MSEISAAQTEWAKIGANLRQGISKKAAHFAKTGGEHSDADTVRVFVSSVLEILEIDILANAFDRAVKNRIEPISRDGDEWKDPDGD